MNSPKQKGNTQIDDEQPLGSVINWLLTPTKEEYTPQFGIDIDAKSEVKLRGLSFVFIPTAIGCIFLFNTTSGVLSQALTIVTGGYLLFASWFVADEIDWETLPKS